MYKLEIKDKKLVRCEILNFPRIAYDEIAVVPDGVEEIGKRAFCMCALGGIILPDGIKKIDDNAFERSVRDSKNKYKGGSYVGSRDNPFMVLVLADITDDNTVEVHPDTRFIDSEVYHHEWYRERRVERIIFGDKLEFIGRYAFEKAGFVNLIIPETVAQIREGAFAGCARLETVDLRSKLTELEQYLFYKCESLKSVALPDRLVSIDDHVFEKCAALAEISLPDSTERIGTCAFCDCTSLKTVMGGKNVTAFGEGAFKNCLALEEFDIPAGMLEIPKELFYGCEKLRRITIPDGVKMIGTGAFSHCKSLEELHIPASVETIDGSFDHCDGLHTVTVDPNNKNYCMRGDSLIEKATDRPVFVGNGSVHDDVFVAGAGKTVIEFKEFFENIYLERVRVAPTVKEIASSAFRGCTALKHIELPCGLEKIGHDVFVGCTALEEITVPKTVTEFGFNVFDGCASLRKIVFNGKLSCFPSFKDCISLTDVIAPSIDNTGYKSFENCTALKEITLPADLEIVGKGSFIGCTALERIVIPARVRSIEANAFSGCAALSEVVIESPNVRIGGYVFSGCKSLTHLTIGKGVTLGVGALGGCDGLKHVTVTPDNELYYVRDDCLFTKDDTLIWMPAGHAFPERVKGIGGGMFFGSAMESFTVPDGVEVIEDSAFAESALKEITLPASLKRISLDSFDACFALRTIYFNGTQWEWNSIDIGADEFDPTLDEEEYFNLVQGVDYTGQIDVICTATG